MNCKIDANLDSPRQCGGQCEGERRYARASDALEMELEWRDQERIAIAELVDQALHLVREVINGAHEPDVLPVASDQLAQASRLLNWPTPFEATRLARNS